jgi:4'-phosphopantetheinyl transferase
MLATSPVTGSPADVPPGLRAHAGAATLPPPADGIAVHLCDLDAGGTAGAIADRALLSSAEQARADRFRFARDRDRYTRGRAFLRRRLAAATGRSAAALVLTEGPRGKPALACGGVEFNLSHSGALAVLAISTRGPVGIDVELVDTGTDLRGLSESCFLEPERAVLDALEEAERRRRFFVFWTAKEALMKLTGQGMSLPPREIALRLEHGWPTGFLRPDAPGIRGAVTIWPDLGRTDAVCCLVRRAEDAE